MDRIAPSDRTLILVISALAGAWVYLWHSPVATTFTRALFVGLPVLGLSLLLARIYRKKPIFHSMMALAALLAIPLLLPSRPVSKNTLRNGYVGALLAYEKTPYVWGGENARGIDCSGLVRIALCDAYKEQAWRTINPGLLRTAASLWWNDASARHLGNGNDSRTILLGRIPSINATEAPAFEPGDLAILDGTHVMAYLGNGRWIGADPGEQCVTVFQPPCSNPWFGMEAQLVRWKSLSHE